MVASLAAAILLSLFLALISFVAWRRDLQEIRRLLDGKIDGEASPEVIVQQARDFVRDHIGYGRHDDYFLLPAFRFMRPTALQVIRAGGDCSYRTRAFIVMLRLHGVHARKLAIYDRDGRPVHAVAEVRSAGQPLYVDLLFNLAHLATDGTPLSLQQLADDDVLRASLQRAVAGGNDQAASYPVDWYAFHDVRTLNWEKNRFTRVAYDLLVATVGESAAKATPRPYLSEEPALMVIVLAIGNALFLLVVLLGFRSLVATRVVSIQQPSSGSRRHTRAGSLWTETAVERRKGRPYVG